MITNRFYELIILGLQQLISHSFLWRSFSFFFVPDFYVEFLHTCFRCTGSYMAHWVMSSNNTFADARLRSQMHNSVSRDDMCDKSCAKIRSICTITKTHVILHAMLWLISLSAEKMNGSVKDLLRISEFSVEMYQFPCTTTNATLFPPLLSLISAHHKKLNSPLST